MSETLQQEPTTCITGSNAACRGADLRTRLDDTLHDVRAQFGELQDTSLRKAREAMRSADASVHQHPYGVLAAVAVTGLLVGFLAARR
ncbi:hypothetical protein H6CHR_03518 [Variovorax sp. PBL-H6]|uniref:DUF883 family protein n=1 Tax=Variovorax sp. PBL-H6 TaxID=434009 RepID=UPI001316E4A7|nr:DUF883 family protein [Variovorax sp. PBL-H6]VTU31031.1 hypothetical protein H6CHR_03518 [Variovorax sp. PBL-H6]